MHNDGANQTSTTERIVLVWGIVRALPATPQTMTLSQLSWAFHNNRQDSRAVKQDKVKKRIESKAIQQVMPMQI